MPERSVIPVDADGSEVKNGSRAAHDVEGDPGVAQRISEHPARVIHLRSSNVNNLRYHLGLNPVCIIDARKRSNNNKWSK